jgi:hypothetical protein
VNWHRASHFAEVDTEAGKVPEDLLGRDLNLSHVQCALPVAVTPRGGHPHAPAKRTPSKYQKLNLERNNNG